MPKIKAFIKRSLIGGVLVILPIAILVFFFRWIFDLVTELLTPLSDLLIKSYGMPHLAADLLAVLIIILLCFVLGTIISTGVGKWAHDRFDSYLAKLAPGYRMIKEIINQFFGDNDDSPFKSGQVARVRLFGKAIETSVTALVTSQHTDGTFSIFIPTGPNPTSGMIYHVAPDLVELLPNIKVDSAMRTIISCGAGSNELFSAARTTKINEAISD
ncbi:MAG: DUF502 domain-containing protein [Pseudomonadales bacterium]|nr:DUF502 domain-containing protein [Pseudomonadales bacterium]MCP5302709.1 DUF502 domain-containing protein [Pseudomonadales bacterium]